MSPFNLKDKMTTANQIIDQSPPQHQNEYGDNDDSPAITPEQQSRFQKMIAEAALETNQDGSQSLPMNLTVITTQQNNSDQQHVESAYTDFNAHNRQPIIEEESGSQASSSAYGEQTPQPYRIVDKSLSQIDEEAEEDGYSHKFMMSQMTPVTPIQYID